MVSSWHPTFDEVTHQQLIKEVMKIGYVNVYSAVTSLLVSVLFEPYFHVALLHADTSVVQRRIRRALFLMTEKSVYFCNKSRLGERDDIALYIQ
jgi:transcription initiation factor IIE alpha subunit